MFFGKFDSLVKEFVYYFSRVLDFIILYYLKCIVFLQFLEQTIEQIEPLDSGIVSICLEIWSSLVMPKRLHHRDIWLGNQAIIALTLFDF